MKQECKKTQNYLHYKQNFPIKSAKDMIRRWGVQKGIVFPAAGDPEYKSKFEKCLDYAGELSQGNWDDFMDFYGSVKRDYPRIPVQVDIFEESN